MADHPTVTLRCPDCRSHLVIDIETGEVLFHKPHKAAPAEGKDFDQLLNELDEGRAEAEDIFNREVSALKDRDRLLEDKFREALHNAKS